MAVVINGDGTVTGISAGGLPDGSISTADIADNAVSSAKIADDAVTLAKLSTTGTPGAGNFLRGDNSWQEAGGGAWTQLARGDTSGGFVTDIDITPADFDLTYNTSQGNASDYDLYKLYTTLETENDSVDYAVRSRYAPSNTWATSSYNHTVTGMMNAANYVHTKSLSQQNQSYWKPLGNQQSTNNPRSRAHQEFTMYRCRDEVNGVIINCITSFQQGVNAGECGVFNASLYLFDQATNGIKLFASSGNIKGAYTLYGVKGS